jgi:Suppressor of fused protein (SUFU)
MITDAVRSAYQVRWGAPPRTAHFKIGALEIDVLKWSEDANPEGVNLYVTLGASAHPMKGRDGAHRLEFFVGLRPAKDEVASPLAALALYPQRENVEVDHGHTIPADGPLWPGTEMRRFLVVRPIVEIIPAVAAPDGSHVEFLQAIPMFESELAYKTEHGAEALLSRWEASRVSFWDPDRSPEPLPI